MKGNQSPGFYFLAFLLALLASFVVSALVSPALQAALAPLQVFPLHRIFSRLAELGLFLGTWWLLRRLGLLDRALMGYGTPRRRWLRRFALGFVGGLALMVAAVLPLFWLGLRALRPELGGLGQILLSRGPAALLTGLSVGLIEETFFRGALQGAMTRRGAFGAALFAVPAFYAAVHFLGDSVRIPYEEVRWTSGFVVLRSFFSAFTRPLAIADAFLALYLVGLLLALVRRRLGDISACMGLHAGFVFVIGLLRSVSVHVDGGRWGWLVGSFDGLLGLWIAATTAVACVVIAAWPAGQNGLAITK